MCRAASPHKKQRPGIRPINKLKGQALLKTGGQATIEATISIIAVFIFLLGAMQIFLWMNRNIINRQKAYQASRLLLGDPARKPEKDDEIISIDFYQPTEFSIFSQNGPLSVREPKGTLTVKEPKAADGSPISVGAY